MKIQVVKDKHGNTVASFEHATASSTKLEPTLHKDHHQVEEVEVPNDYLSNLHVLYKPRKRD